MQFSKIKKQFMSLLAPSLRGRLDLFSGIYRKAHDGETFVAFTFDGKELYRATTIPYSLNHTERYERAKKMLPARPEKIDFTIFESDWYKASQSLTHQIDEEMNNEGLFDVYAVLTSLMEYPQLSIEAAIHSDNPFIRGLSFLDRRFGLRRLATVNRDLTEFEQLCYKVRKEAELIRQSD